MLKVYISGPMTGIENYNYPAFEDAAIRLRQNGLDVVNPVDIARKFGTVKELEQNAHLRYEVQNAELEAVKDCKFIYLLRGWQNSIGAKKELEVALMWGLDILLER